MAWCERLSGLDAMFLYIEDQTAHMHVGAVSVFEGASPAYADLLAHVASRLDRALRCRQRVAFVPLALARPVWVDDEAFELEYHVRHTALPSPGGAEPLKKLAARVFAQRLDRDRPLWELWLVEGLGANRFAIITKVHHCMIDGIAGADLATVLLGDGLPEVPQAPWAPRPVPGRSSLAASAVASGLTLPLRAARDVLEPGSGARRFLRELGAGLKPLLGLATLGRAPPSSLNRAIGPHRRWEMVNLELAEVKAVRAALGGTVNDVLLAVVAGALRALFTSRGEAQDMVRAMVPVSMRAPGAEHQPGNQVSAVFCALPVGEPDAVRRLRLVSAEMNGLKGSGQALGTLAWVHLGDYAPPPILARVAQFQSAFRYMNVVVTNIPGPRDAVSLFGRTMREWYPLVPLAAGQTLGIALQSYHGSIGIGLLGAAEAMRDLPVLAKAIPEELAKLSQAAQRTRG